MHLLIFCRVRYKMVRDELKSKPDYSQSEISQRKHYSLLVYAILATIATVSKRTYLNSNLFTRLLLFCTDFQFLFLAMA